MAKRKHTADAAISTASAKRKHTDAAISTASPNTQPLPPFLACVPSRFHPAVDQDFVIHPEEQTVADFVDMGQREPNEEGTGRWLYNEKRRRIRILTLGRASKSVSKLVTFLEAFFCGRFTFAVDNSAPRPPVTKKSYRTWNKAVEIWSILDELIPLVSNTDFGVLALTDWPLCEDYSDNGDGSDAIEVLGRACGDRVCVVSSSVPSIFELCCMTVHEILHLCGFDHTTSVQCLMNPSPYEPLLAGTVFLAPFNIWKLCILFNVVEPESAEEFVIKHYENMLEVWDFCFDSSGTTEESDARKWLVRRLKWKQGSSKKKSG